MEHRHVQFVTQFEAVIKAQKKIGWNNFQKGFLSTQWGATQYDCRIEQFEQQKYNTIKYDGRFTPS